MPGVNCQFSRRCMGRRRKRWRRQWQRLTETLASANMGNDTRKSLVNNSLAASVSVCVRVEWPLLSTPSSSSSWSLSSEKKKQQKSRATTKICDTRRSFNRRMQILSRLPRKTTLRRGAKGAAAPNRYGYATR